MTPLRVDARLWDEARVESLAARVDVCSRAISQLGARFEPSASRAARLAAALRTAGQALAFVDEDDGDAVWEVIERLEQLEREADELHTLWHDDVTAEYPAPQRWEARNLRDDEATRVRPKIVPPLRALGARGT